MAEVPPLVMQLEAEYIPPDPFSIRRAALELSVTLFARNMNGVAGADSDYIHTEVMRLSDKFVDYLSKGLPEEGS